MGTCGRGQGPVDRSHGCSGCPASIGYSKHHQEVTPRGVSHFHCKTPSHSPREQGKWGIWQDHLCLKHHAGLPFTVTGLSFIGDLSEPIGVETEAEGKHMFRGPDGRLRERAAELPVPGLPAVRPLNLSPFVCKMGPVSALAHIGFMRTRVVFP